MVGGYLGDEGRETGKADLGYPFKNGELKKMGSLPAERRLKRA